MTSGDEIYAVRRARIANAPPILRGGFRLFFFGGAAWAVIALVIWLVALAGGASLSSQFDPLAWHRHEMLFGFVGAVITGFLLAAIPNWTGRPAIAGTPLAALFALWVSARIAVLFSVSLGPVAAILDVGFYLVVAFLAAREVLAARNRNLPIAGLLLLFALASGVDHAAAGGLMDDPDLGFRAAIALITLMITLVGGRIVPVFTRNWMVKQQIANGLPAQAGRFDLGVIAITAIALLSWLVAAEAIITGWLLVAAGLAHLARLARWAGLRSIRDPLVFILHVGYFWIPVGLCLLGASLVGGDIPRSAAVHALTAGAMGTMILAVMTRATLGHTGRPLQASPPTLFLYVLVTIGALLRVMAPLGLIDYRLGMEISAMAWAGAFLLFLGVYGPMLFRPRIGEGA